jgi:hypothetical protein
VVSGRDERLELEIDRRAALEGIPDVRRRRPVLHPAAPFDARAAAQLERPGRQHPLEAESREARRTFAVDRSIGLLERMDRHGPDPLAQGRHDDRPIDRRVEGGDQPAVIGPGRDPDCGSRGVPAEAVRDDPLAREGGAAGPLLGRAELGGVEVDGPRGGRGSIDTQRRVAWSSGRSLVRLEDAIGHRRSVS